MSMQSPRVMMIAALLLVAPVVGASADEAAIFKAVPMARMTAPNGWSLTAYPYWSAKNIFGFDPNTSAHVDQRGVVGVFEYETPRWNFAFIGEAGHTHVTYLQVLQDTLVGSGGFGMRAGVHLGPVTVTAGGSLAHDSFESILQNNTDDWSGSEQELHVSLNGDLNIAGPLWLKPMAGFRYLGLYQDSHFLGASFIPNDNRISRLLFAGSKVQLEFNDLAGGALRPWVFGGVTRDLEDQPPMGPSVFLAEQVAGNQFTIFPASTVGAPPIFPARTTEVFGVGIDMDIRKTLTFHAAYYREFNDMFGSVNYRFGAGIHW